MSATPYRTLPYPSQNKNTKSVQTKEEIEPQPLH